MKRTIRLSLQIAAILVVPALAGESPFAGEWQLNHEKSHFSHGELPQSLVITIEPNGPDAIRYQSRNQVGEKAGGISYVAKLDGTGALVTGTDAYDTASVRQIDAHTLSVQMKKNGAVVVDAVYKVSANGKSLTRKGTAKKGPGEANSFEEWFDRLK
jgi:hypothetical protein